MAGNLRGELRRTKTTGPDKQNASRAFVVSSECYLSEPHWLATGLEIWSSFSSDRPFLLLFPTADLSNVTSYEVQYSDAVALSRALRSEFSDLEVWNDGTGAPPLLLAEASCFWSEHSPRHDMPSWVASLLTVPDDWLNLLGGWAIKGSAPRYVETAERRIMLMQAAVADKLRSQKKGPDLVDEEKLWWRLSEYLDKKGVPAAECAAQVDRLRWFTGEARARAGNLRLASRGLSDDLEPDLNLASVSTIFEDPPSTSKADSVPAELHGKYAVSITRKSGHRCLHLLGACHRSPRVHYADFEIYDIRPPGTVYHDFCRQCWKSLSAKTGEADASSCSSSESGTE